MQKIEAIFRTQRLADVQSALETIHVNSFTISDVHGIGREKGVTHTYRGAQYTINLASKVKLEVVVQDEEVDDVIAAIQNCARTGEVGDGKIFVIPIGDVVRIRNGERGESAV